ncbi:hypothetical protein P153DRAFT_385073 [Dothidotthia symphoricarpi CBS 119687]|uniref:Ribosomal protein L11 n=1 Tax=Dothidotthia symphoricarpi CBS 119687 TaxID=1392245 RepID=A0A6A6AFX9_9PLEO|nr:uncharacterized protein P153DRAFT_385073 [Dothidotthia symphoricarpi CBS 119687]KAF2129844.1 hypothetical protein P153DRAFT_385073 [Dothidotthia symphoricarpi CBS 119687]
MARRGAPAIVTAALLLQLLPLAFAHGDEHHGASMDMNAHDSPNPQIQNDERPQSYWSLSEHATLMYWHIGLEILAWTVILPVAVMLSIARSRFTLPSQFVFLAVNALALIIGNVYNNKTPELYANNMHGKTGWAITWIGSAWVLMALVQMYTGRDKAQSMEGEVAQPVTAVNMAQYQRVREFNLPDPSRWSNDSGQGTERNSASLYSHSRSPSVESENQQLALSSPTYADFDDNTFDSGAEKRGFLRNTSVDRFFSRNVARWVAGRTLKAIRFLYIAFERTMLIQGFVAITTGTVVYGGIARGPAIMNVLAHYVKGGMFFLYGLVTLGRWVGAFADLGWAWNMKPPKESFGRRRMNIPSAEFAESFLFWLYGCTNVFLEHLAAWGGAWTAQDLEHVSISVLFFGGGLLGMIVESTKMRDLLNHAVISSQASADLQNEAWQPPRHYRFSVNPIPALVIMLLGKMMSSHHQTSMVSTMIHSQWGNMFMGAALARGFTYVIMYMSPPTSFLPSRPPTELITAFCFVSGGMTFMLSNKDTVAALESYNLDAMFIFTVVMGFTALLLAWSTVVIAIKGWAQGKENRSLYAKSRTAPKFDPSEVKVIHLRATGGEVGASSALAPKIGPLGLSPKKVGEDIAKATGDWKGLRVTVKLTIQNRQAAVSVVPSASSLVIKALKEPPRDRKKEKNIKHTKSVPLDEIINIARTMRFKSMAKDLKGTVKEILGTAFSTGCQVDGRSPKDISDDIESGEIEIPEE